jgi:predicted ribosome quality control (RQC) complex YloA/Tae2 family protein
VSFDSLTLRSVTAQLKESVIEGKILSVIQSSPLEFTLRIAAREHSQNLLFSIHPAHARVHLTAERPELTKRWHFADFLQKHIQDGNITSIEQVDFDRVIKIHISPQAEILNPVSKILIGEFMGKHSNVILVEEDTDRILESMKHIDETMSRYRQILPGLDYVMPPVSQKLDPFSTDKETFSAVLTSGNDPLWRKLLNNFQGMSPLLAKEIIARAPDESIESVWNVFVSLMDDIQAEKFRPTVISRDSDEDDVLAVSPIALQQFHDGHAISFPTISDALEFFYRRRIAKESFLAQKAAVFQATRKRYEALQQKHESLKRQLEVSESADELKLRGDLLIANLHRIKRGQKEVSLQNFYDPDGPEVTIKLDERLNPSNNAQKYFQEYKKAKRSKDILTKLVSKNQAAMGYMRKIIENTEEAEDLGALETIRNNLEQRGIIKKQNVIQKQKGKERNREEIPLFRRFRSSEGFQIYVGRNEKENELLLKRESSKNDMWLHAKQIEGSHVIVRNPEKRPDIPKRTLLEAAIIAAHFSKAKHSGLVPVDYTWVKYVNKPRGGKRGFVTYTHEKTLFVSPSDFQKTSSSS